jgi:hypothetical protein
MFSRKSGVLPWRSLMNTRRASPGDSTGDQLPIRPPGPHVKS